MSRDSALVQAVRLKVLMAKRGVKASIEIQEGRSWDGDPWMSKKYALMNHHTAGPKQGLTPCLGVVKRGRSDLPGPLANGYGGRDLVYRIITLGLANHPGQGGPITLAGVTVPRDSARISTWGTEWEHDGISPWPADMQEFMGRANAALLEWMGRPVDCSIEHSTWTTRKIDRNGYTARGGQAEILKWEGAPPMSAKEYADKVWGADTIPIDDPPNPKNPTWTPRSTLGWLVKRVRAQDKTLKAQGDQLDRIEALLRSRT